MDRKYLVRFERKAEEQQPDGTLSAIRKLLFEAYATVLPIRGRERDQSSQTEAVGEYRFTIRRKTGLTENDVIVWNGCEYNIRFIGDHGPQSMYMPIYAERGVAV
ncbi:MAG: head-tail adaptor protein [Pseudomonadota bacterium]